MAGPLGGEGLGELDDTGLGGVVAGMLLRVVDDGAEVEACVEGSFTPWTEMACATT